MQFSTHLLHNDTRYSIPWFPYSINNFDKSGKHRGDRSKQVQKCCMRTEMEKVKKYKKNVYLKAYYAATAALAISYNLQHKLNIHFDYINALDF